MDSTNDNCGYHLDPDTDSGSFNQTRIDEASGLIVSSLRVLFESGGDHLEKVLKQGTAYHNGLQNGETMLAILKALSNYQVEVIDKLADMNFGDDFPF